MSQVRLEWIIVKVQDEPQHFHTPDSWEREGQAEFGIRRGSLWPGPLEGDSALRWVPDPLLVLAGIHSPPPPRVGIAIFGFMWTLCLSPLFHNKKMLFLRAGKVTIFVGGRGSGRGGVGRRGHKRKVAWKKVPMSYEAEIQTDAAHFYGGYPDCCYEIQVRFMIFFILNMICYANAACDSLIKSICYHEAKRGRWDFRITGRVREACGFVIRHHFAHCHTARGSVCALCLLWPPSSLVPSPTPCRHSDPLPKWLHNSRSSAV